MTAAALIRSLPRDPLLARLQLAGALDRRWGGEWSTEDVARLEMERDERRGMMRRAAK